MGSGTVAPSKDVKADMSGVKGSTGSVNKKPVPPVPAPHKPGATPAVAMFDYRGERSTDLSFKKGDKIDVVKYGAPTEWWTGSLNGGPVGEFPGMFIHNWNAFLPYLSLIFVSFFLCFVQETMSDCRSRLEKDSDCIVHCCK